MSRKFILSIPFFLLIVAFAGSAAADDYLYVRNSTVSDTPKVILRLDNSLGDMPFRENPALLTLDCPYLFLFDGYYLGSYSKITTSDVMISNGTLTPGPGAGLPLGISTLEGEYFSNYGGVDVGFAMKLSSRSNLAFIFNYLYGNVRGEASIWSWNVDGNGLPLYFTGDESDKFESNRYAPTVLFSTKPSDKLSIGAGLTYAFITDDLSIEIFGPMAYGVGGATGTGLWDSGEDLKLRYHRLSPVLGVSFEPASSFRLDAWLGADFSFGSVYKDSALASFNTLSGVYNVFSEDLDSKDLFGWRLRGALEATFSRGGIFVPAVFVSGSYGQSHWGVDGTASGDMEPDAYWGVYRGGGPIDYDNDSTNWDVQTGVKLRIALSDTSGITITPMYAHAYFRNDFSQTNDVTQPGAQGPGLSLFTQDDRVTKDIVSLSLTFEKEFSQKFSAEVGTCYDYGWAARDYDIYYTSGYDLAGGYLSASNSGKDQYQDLSFWLKTTFRPTDRLAISLSSMVKIPLDPVDYHMPGTAINTDPAAYRFYTSGIDREYEDSTWIYGGLLTVTYEFGCPVAVPPAPAPAPVIEPKLEPMSFK